MRIIGYLENRPCKVTVFEMDDKISVKFEVDLLEQTYKFRKSEILGNINDVEKLVDEKLMDEIMIRFLDMKKTFDRSVRRMGYSATIENEFDTII